MSKLERKRNIIGALLLALAILLLGVLIFQNFQAQVERDVAQSSAATSQQLKRNLAEELTDACKSGQVIKSSAGVDLCARAADIAKQPVTTAGPVGPRGLPGVDGVGKDGAAGATGKTGAGGSAGIDGLDSTTPGTAGLPGLTGKAGTDSTVPGPAGPPGKDGPAGVAGKDGAPGKDGSDSTAPGPQGPAGSSVESFSFTDQDGIAYFCTPNPPGSSAFTCAAAADLEPTP